MATLATLTEQDVIALSARLTEPEWLLERRQEAFKAFSDLEWPTNRDEAWRFTNPNRFDLTRELVERAAPAALPGDGEAAREASAALLRDSGVAAAVRNRLAAHVALVDAGVATATVTLAAAARGVVAGDLSAAARDHEAVVREALGSAVGDDGKFAAANLAAFTAGAFVHVPADVELDAPVAVTVQVTRDGAVAPRVLVVLGPHARAQLYLDHHGDAETTVVEVVEFVLGEGARLDVVTAQDWGPRVDHVGAHTGRVGANADHRHLEVTLGGRTVYLTPDVRLVEPHTIQRSEGKAKRVIDKRKMS